MLHIRAATPEDADHLTRISFASKGYWNYPEAWYQTWCGELTITAGYIENNRVFVIEQDTAVIGYYSVVYLEKDHFVLGSALGQGYWLEHMFVAPEFIGRGAGTRMVGHLKSFCKKHRISRLAVLADPHSRGFYEKLGFAYQGEVASTIADRTTPLLILQSHDCGSSTRPTI